VGSPFEQPPEQPAAQPSPPPEPAFVLGELSFPAQPDDAPAAAAPDTPVAPRRRRRRAVAVPGAAARPALVRATDPVLRWGTPGLLALAPLAWGSVVGWSEMAVVVGAAALGSVWLLRLALHPDALALERSAGSHGGTLSPRLVLPLVAVIAVGLLQLAPLGPLVRLVSPVGAQIQQAAGIGPWAAALSVARPQTLRSLAQIAAFGLLFFAVLDGLPGRAEVRRLAAVMVVLGFAHGLGGILWHYQATGRAYWGPAAGGASFGPYINRNHFACLVGMVIPLGVGLLLGLGRRRAAAGALPAASARGPEAAGPQRFLVGFMVAVTAGALALSLSRGGIVSTLVALAALAVAVGVGRATRGQLWKAAAAVAASLAFAVWLAAGPLLTRLGTLGGLFTNDALTAPRTGIWLDALRLAADFPLFGAGYGAFAEIYPRYQTAHLGGLVTHAHNDWLQLLAEGGLAGSLAVLGLVGYYLAAASRLLRRRRDPEAIVLGLGALAGVLAFALHAGTDFNTHIPANALWFTVLAALGLKALSSRRDQVA
jgi:O-antigen ligase